MVETLSSRHLKTKLNKTQLLLFLGFSSSIVLFIILTSIGLSQLQQSTKRTDTILSNHNVKTELVEKMEKAARERSLALYTMVFLKDPFERDEVFLQFKGYAIDFINARTQILEMDLTDEESSYLETQGEFTSLAVPLQNRVVDLVQENKIPQAQQVLLNNAIPAQNRVLAELNKLHNLQSEANRKLGKELEKRYHEQFNVILVLALMTLALTITIAFFVSRYISRSEKKLFVEKELAQVTLHSIGDGVITTDKRGIIRTINPVAEELTGYNSDEAIGHDVGEIFSIKKENSNDYIDNPIEVALQNNAIYTSPFNMVLERKNGDIFAIEHTVSPIRGVQDEILGANIVFRDVTEMRKLADKLSYQATHDSLTGLINRREFERRLKNAIYNAHNDGEQYALCFLDLDQFKIINDTAGHAAGDEFLKQVAHHLSANLRRTDVLARLGGDEFAILLDDCSLKTADMIANKTCESVKNMQFAWEKNIFSTGTSIGIVPINEYTSTVSEAMSAADTACYEAKEKGRNRVQTYWLDDEKLELKRQEMAWVQKLKLALDEDQFILFAQEFVELNKTSGCSAENRRFFEILIRLKDPQNNPIPPMAFLPAAERYHLMPKIDRWVIKNTFRFYREISEICGTQCHFSINLSGQTITESDLYDFIIEMAEEYEINPSQICFEVTETAAIANMSKAVKLIKTLKSANFRFSLDDFGSGLSSFAYLKNMPVDNLKIDGAFIKDIVDDSTDLAFVEAIQRIAEMMDIRTTAEFVENEETLKILKKIGINFAQGYHIAKPVDLLSLVEENQITFEKRASF
ncbi:MAG: EAL domain-containing protein [Thioalkalispiraceae bacterium]|jgi:diguanylate cyclase (GGDEF)-like protein/PAS domain S-box-containing protein